MFNEKIRIHLEPELILEGGSRLLNHVDLGDCGFIPQVVIPPDASLAREDGVLPVEHVAGVSWNDLIWFRTIPLSIHIEIALATIRQISSLWEERGLLIMDRHPGNIMVKGQLGQGVLSELDVVQVDLEFVYDRQLCAVRYGRNFELNEARNKNTSPDQAEDVVVRQLAEGFKDIWSDERWSSHPDSEGVRLMKARLKYFYSEQREKLTSLRFFEGKLILLGSLLT